MRVQDPPMPRMNSTWLQGKSIFQKGAEYNQARKLSQWPSARAGLQGIQV